MKNNDISALKKVAMALMCIAVLIYFYLFFAYTLPTPVHVGILAIVLLFYIGLELFERNENLEIKATNVSKLKKQLVQAEEEKKNAIAESSASKQSQKIYENKYNEIVVNRNKLIELVHALEEKIQIQEKNFQRELAHAKLDAELDAREQAIYGRKTK